MHPKLLILSSEFPPGPGGIGTHAHELARHLSDGGWSISVVTAQDYVAAGELESFDRGQPFPVIRLPKSRSRVWQTARRWAAARRQQHSAQLVVATGRRAVLLAASAIQLPWVAIGHGSEFASQPGLRRTLVRWGFQRARAVVCVSRYTWDRMLAIGIRPRAGTVIPNGADPEQCRPVSNDDVRRFRRQLGLDQARLILTVGHVTERKGQDVVVRAMPRIVEAVPDAHYLVAGLPTERERLAEIARQAGVAERVHFLGRVDNGTLNTLLHACDVFAMTSRLTARGECEGYGIAVVEAAFRGKPAVVSAVSGLCEAVADGETGLCVPPEDVAATGTAIVSLLRDEARRRSMGDAARRRALAEQTWRQCADKYDHFLRQVLADSTV